MGLPKVVYVYEEEDVDGSRYLVASSDKEAQAGIIGVYSLQEKLEVRYKTEFRRPKTKRWFS